MRTTPLTTEELLIKLFIAILKSGYAEEDRKDRQLKLLFAEK